MRRIIYFYLCKSRYYSSFPIINNIRILFNNYERFKTYKIEPVPFTKYVKSINYSDFLVNDVNIQLEKERNNHNFPVQWELGYDKAMALLDEGVIELRKHMEEHKNEYKKAIILMFHPVAYISIYKERKNLEDLKKELGIKYVLWQDDLHAYFKEGKRGEILEGLNCIISPSPIFFKNIKSKLEEKTKFFFYSMDFSLLKDVKWENRERKILLSGACNKGYPLRYKLSLLINKEFSKIGEHLRRPRQKEYNKPLGTYVPVGLNYYDILVKYKGAFFGYYEYPKNFNLAKIIEICACGCLGFFERSPLLEEEMGMKAFEHYIPITDENGKLIEDVSYYESWLDGNRGRAIAEHGRNHIYNNFSNENGFINYVKILKKL